MSTFARWVRFNFVGAMGVGVQLAALHLLNHAWHGHYLLATAAALELTLLHNFLWHLRYTWRDRRYSSRWQPFVRFHLTSGLTSLVGNLVLMRLAVRTFHLAILPANMIAIAVCSVGNFFLSHFWSFPSGRSTFTGTYEPSQYNFGEGAPCMHTLRRPSS